MEKEINNTVIVPLNMLRKNEYGHHCKCRTSRKYNEEFDCYYCPKCNWWLEPHCGDKKCYFCSVRPKRPLEVNRSGVHYARIHTEHKGMDNSA